MAVTTPQDLVDQTTGKPKPSYTGSLPEYQFGAEDAFGGKGFPTASYPGAPEHIKRIMDSQLDLSKNYESQAQGNIDKQQALYNQSARSGLANSIKGVRSDFNHRGLLRSGMRQGAESGAINQTAADMALNRFNLNQQSQGGLEQLQNNAVGSGLLYTGNAPGLGASVLSGTQQGLENDLSNSNALSGFLNTAGSGIGNLAGSILAKRKSA